MAGITHHKVATLADDPSAEVGKDEWNEAHDLDDITSLPTAETDATKVLAPDGLGGVEFRAETGGGGGGAPTTADYLVGTANAGLSNEIAVGTTPGGELGGTWASPTVDATHSGSTHAATQSAAEATAASALSGHEADTTSIHGIANTAVLATATSVATAVTNHEGAGDPHPGYVTTAEGATLVSDHVAAGDPHTGYRLESADHTHASSGLQGGTVAYSAITGTPAAERAASSTTPAAVGSAAVGTGTTDARSDHVHATGAGTPSTQAFGDAASTGSGPAAAMTDHKHAMPNGLTVGSPAPTWGVAAATGAASTGIATDARLVGDYTICQGRLTLTTAVPVTTSDVTAATTLYFTPYKGSLVGTYNGTDWNVAAFTEKSITLASLTAGLPYDVFIVNSTLALELLAWTNATTRATALVTQDGVLCKTGALTRRYLGTICIAATGQSEDSKARRLVWNYYNRIERPLAIFDSTDTWNYGTATWRAANGTTTNHNLNCVVGVSEDIARIRVFCQVNTSGGSNAGSVGIGLDSTSANSAEIFTEYIGTTLAAAGTLGTQAHAQWRGWPGVGYHAFNWLEYARAGTVSYQGDNGVADMQSGMLGEVLG